MAAMDGETEFAEVESRAVVDVAARFSPLGPEVSYLCHGFQAEKGVRLSQ